MKAKRPWAPNGIISKALTLSAAIRYFSGGSPYDIALSHGISHSAVFDCVWEVVNAVNACPSLCIRYPRDHDSQKKIALGFQKKSKLDSAHVEVQSMVCWFGLNVHQKVNVSC